MAIPVDIQMNLQRFFSERPEIIGVYLFGSHANETATPLSDMDLGLVMEQAFQDHKKQLEYELDLESSLIQSFQEQRFDIRVINEAPVIVQGKIITEGKEIYCSDPVRIRSFVEYVLMLYLDYKPVYDSLLEAYYNQQSDG